MAGDYPSLQALLEAALSAFLCADIRVVRRSGWWRSAAWPDPGAPAYLNGSRPGRDGASAEGVAGRNLLDIEAAFGRGRTEPNAPRTLDLDLIAYGREVIDDPGLVVPHPRAAARRFIMGPLAEIAPDWVHPVLGVTAAELAAKATIGLDAHPTRRKVETGQSGEA